MTTSSPTLYKVLVNGRSCHGGSSTYPLPNSKPGRWTRTIPDVRVCESGYHLTTDPMRWPAVGMTVYEAEGKGAADTRDDKTAFASVRLIRDVTADTVPEWWRAVEAFVAELPTLPWFAPQGPPDPAWRVFSTRAAARAAAGAAARAAARAAAGAAARAAARAAAGVAARAAARAAAGVAARDAAGVAARDAAGDAARDAAGDAAGAAAWDAAGDAVWAAALWALMLVCDGLPLIQRHIDHARARMDVWRRGYGVYGDVDGVLYVYERIA